MKPLFLLSLPRAGSTLVQRVLGAHPDVATASEPWVLLPFLYADRPFGARAEYWHVSAAQAIDDFRQELDGGPEAYRDELRAFVMRLYERAAPPGAAYFLDKTPRYHFIAEELPRVFPDARFVFLWRNPLSVLGSHLDTFRDGRFEPYLFERDLHDGPRNLLAGARAAGDRGVGVRFEDLVTGGEDVWRGVFDRLDLPFDPSVLERFTQTQLKGRYGDPTGVHRYASVSTEPLVRWKQTLAGPVRKAWCKRYLRALGPAVLEGMGYDLDELVGEVDAVRGRGDPRDAAHLAASLVASRARERALHMPEGPQPRGGVFARRRS